MIANTGSHSFTAGVLKTFGSSSTLQLAWLLYVLVLVTAKLLFVSANDEEVDPGSDFGGYVEEMERRERAERLYEAKLDTHEAWRQTTWAGFCVRQIQALGRHFRPFFIAVQDALNETSGDDNNGQKSPFQILAYIGIRMVVVIGVLTVFWAGGKVLQLFVGKDYEIVKEVVVVHEHATEEDAARARAKTTRGKKQKAS